MTVYFFSFFFYTKHHHTLNRFKKNCQQQQQQQQQQRQVMDPVGLDLFQKAFCIIASASIILKFKSDIIPESDFWELKVEDGIPVELTTQWQSYTKVVVNTSNIDFIRDRRSKNGKGLIVKERMRLQLHQKHTDKKFTFWMEQLSTVKGYPKWEQMHSYLMTYFASSKIRVDDDDDDDHTNWFGFLTQSQKTFFIIWVVAVVPIVLCMYFLNTSIVQIIWFTAVLAVFSYINRDALNRGM